VLQVVANGSKFRRGVARKQNPLFGLLSGMPAAPHIQSATKAEKLQPPLKKRDR